jgi:hypothetical protein
LGDSIKNAAASTCVKWRQLETAGLMGSGGGYYSSALVGLSRYSIFLVVLGCKTMLENKFLHSTNNFSSHSHNWQRHVHVAPPASHPKSLISTIVLDRKRDKSKRRRYLTLRGHHSIMNLSKKTSLHHYQPAA